MAWSRQRAQRRRVARVAGHHVGDDALAPLGVRQRADGDVGDTRVRRQHRFDRFGPHVLAAGDDELGPAAVDDETVLAPLSEVAGREPPVRVARIGPVTVGPQQEWRAESDLTVSADVDFHAVERHAVVHAAATRLRHAVGDDGVRRRLGRRPRPTEHDGAKPRRVDARQSGGNERHQRGTCGAYLGGVEGGQHGEASAGVQGPRHHGHPADVGDG